MRLFEHESKDLLRQVGITVPQGCVVDRLSEIGRLDDAAFPAVVKAEVLSGGRMKAGAILFVTDRETARGAVNTLLGMWVNGQVCRRVLIERRVSICREYYLGVTYDVASKDPVAIFSSVGGIDVEKQETHKALLQTLPPPSQYQFKELVSGAGIGGRQLAALATVFYKLATVFLQRDCTLAEINPLVETSDGTLLAVDCHIDIDDDALFRHQELLSSYDLTGRAEGAREKTPFELAAERIDAADHRGVAGRVVEFPGSLGLLIGGGGASLTAFDAIRRHGGDPANYCEIGGNPSVSKVKELVKLILSRPGVERMAVLMNVVSNTRVDLVARGVIKGILELGWDPADKIAIFRIPGAWEEDGFAILRKYGVNFVDRTVSIDEAARRAVRAGG